MSTDPKLTKILIGPNATISECKLVIDTVNVGLALVVDSDGVLRGAVTNRELDGVISSGISLHEPVWKIMNPSPIAVTQGTGLQEIGRIMVQHKLKRIPVLDPEGRLVDFVTISNLVRVPLSSPDITHREVQAIHEVLSTPTLSLGTKLLEFEDKFASYIGVEHAVAVSSGTSGLHLCMKSLGIGEGDEVITTPFSFIASANSIIFEGAAPVFVDIDPLTLGIDVSKVEEKITPRTKAILPVHVFGHPCDMVPLLELASKRGLHVIEDCCEAIGAEYLGTKVGTFGKCGVFSFYPNKQITTAEGGIIVTNDAEIAELCRSYRNQGRNASGDRWLNYDRIGYNFRLSELHCALGIAQLERIQEILDKRGAVAHVYNRRLQNCDGVILPYVAPGVKMSWFVYVVRIAEEVGDRRARDEVILRLGAQGIACSNYFPPIHLQPAYRELFGYQEGSFPITEEISKRTIALPFFNNLPPEVTGKISDALVEAVSHARVPQGSG